MDSQTQLTEEFLNCISSHLSGRPDCSKLQYRLTIDDNTGIEFWPEIKLFPSRLIRNKASKSNVINHVIMNHFYDELYADKHPNGSIVIQCSKLVNGEYKYQLSVNEKKRRWIRIK